LKITRQAQAAGLIAMTTPKRFEIRQEISHRLPGTAGRKFVPLQERDASASILPADCDELAAARHDRTIINVKPEHVDAWLNPEPDNLAASYAIFDDKRHPYYEHRLAA